MYGLLIFNVLMLGFADNEEGKRQSVGYIGRPQERWATESVVVWCIEVGKETAQIWRTAQVTVCLWSLMQICCTTGDEVDRTNSLLNFSCSSDTVLLFSCTFIYENFVYLFCIVFLVCILAPPTSAFATGLTVTTWNYIMCGNKTEMKWHLSIMGIIKDAACKDGKEAPQVAAHFISECDWLVLLRWAILGKFCLHQTYLTNLIVGDLMRFILKMTEILSEL